MEQVKLLMHDDTYVAVVVNILRVASSCYRRVRSNTRVDTINAPERVHICKQVGQCLVRARLERSRVTARSRVEGVNRGQDRVRVLTRPPAAGVRSDIGTGRVPV